MDYESHPTKKKIEAVEELSSLFQKSTGLYLADFTGLNVEQANSLRSDFYKQKIIYRVVKNSLIEHACNKTGYKELIPHLEGPTALAISLDDPVAPIRVIAAFVKDLEKKTPIFKAGLLEKAYVDAKAIESLKDIPPREVLLAQIFSTLQAPMANFAGVLNEIVRSFVGVLQAIIDKRKAAGEE